VWWRKVAATSSGAANAAAARVVDDAMLLHNGVWGLVRSMTGQKAAQTVAVDEVCPIVMQHDRTERHCDLYLPATKHISGQNNMHEQLCRFRWLQSNENHVLQVGVWRRGP